MRFLVSFSLFLLLPHSLRLSSSSLVPCAEISHGTRTPFGAGGSSNKLLFFFFFFLFRGKTWKLESWRTLISVWTSVANHSCSKSGKCLFLSTLPSFFYLKWTTCLPLLFNNNNNKRIGNIERHQAGSMTALVYKSRFVKPWKKRGRYHLSSHQVFQRNRFSETARGDGRKWPGIWWSRLLREEVAII